MTASNRAQGPRGRRRIGSGARAVALALSLAGLAAGEAAATSASAPATPPATAQAPADSLCASYGAGFVRVPGTSTCMKVGASTQADTYSAGGTSTFSGNSAIAPALRSQ
ncbi:porin [Ancylobacter lacus]|uniref:porin n=1 Tax=Ancylobacter lacus TaxID=2579970 RepID=UPI001BCA9BFE|nr:porin [Ancylobacter lacus]MBS7539629.1 porin [Ancylobacter lacus]